MAADDRTQMVLRDGTVVPSQRLDDDTQPVKRVSRMRLLHGVTLAEIEPVVRRCTLQEFASGETVLAAGTQNEALFVVLSGSVRIDLGDESIDSRYVIGEGECFGEMSLIDGHEVSARVVAESGCRLLKVSAEVFWSDFVRVRGIARNLFATMASRLRTANEATLRNLRRRMQLDQLHREMHAAREIQASMIPGRGELFSGRKDLRCAGAMIPAQDTAGDFFDALLIDEHQLFFVVGDVSGKGFAAALFMARAMPLLRGEMLRRKSVSRTLAIVNDQLAANNASCMFVTAGCGLLDARTGLVTYANAGHLAPLLARRDGSLEVVAVPNDIVLGAMEGQGFEEVSLRLEPGDTLFLYSDGVTEAFDSGGDQFGHARLLESVREAARKRLEELVDGVRDAVQSHAGSTPQSDDITLLAIRYLGPGADRSVLPLTEPSG